jgi:hypothetical protein
MARPTEVTISIETSSQEIPLNPFPPPQFPSISLNGTAIPSPSYVPPAPSGFQVVVMNSAGDLSDPANIVANSYEPIPSGSVGGWYDTYQFMYDGLARDIFAAGDPQQQLVFVASYGLDVAMLPTPAVAELLLNLGAGPQFQKWLSTDVPSEGGDWTEYPADYVLIGGSGYGYGQGTEQFDYTGVDEQSVTTHVSVTIQNNPEPPTPAPTQAPSQSEPSSSY